MLQKIEIKKNISTQVYNFEKENSKSYIIDEEYRSDIMLDGVSSDIWQVILKTQDYNSVLEYSKKRGVDDSLNDFLCELINSNAIVINQFPVECSELTSKNFEQSSDIVKTKGAACGGLDEEDEYTEERTKWLYENNFLQYLAIQLSYKCNLSCAHCFNDKEHNEVELTFEEVKSAVDQAVALGITTVGLTGGECSVHKDFLNIIRYIREKHLSLIFLTNGQKMYDDENLFESIVSLYPHRIKLSLYSMKEAVHDQITGVKGSFKKTVDVIRRLRERNILVTINFLQLQANFGDYYEILEFGQSVGARVEVAVHFIDNPNNHNHKLRIHGELLEKLYMEKDYPVSVYNMKLSGFKNDNRTVCRASEIVLSVNPFFEVTPCNDFDYSFGNLRKISLNEIWTNVVPEFRNKFIRSNMKDCGVNEYCNYCSYCPMRAYYENGFMKRSNAGCEHAIAYYNALKKLSLV